MATFDDVLKELSPVHSGDSVFEVASAARMNAIMEAIHMLVMGENVMEGPNIRKDSSSGKLILSADPVGVGRGGGAFKHPFKVVHGADNSFPPYPILKVLPGRVGLIMPTLANAALDKLPPPAPGPHPWFYSPTGPYSLWLKVNIDTSSTQLNQRAGIVSAQVVATNDPLLAAMLADAPEPVPPETLKKLPELQMRWDGHGTENVSNTKGFFLIKIADITAVTDGGGNIVVKTITQFLTQSYHTFAVSNLEVVPMA